MSDTAAPRTGSYELWPAPHPQQPVDAVVRLPGSKSLTNRALLLAALADGPSVVRQALDSRDTQLMTSALSDLGAAIDTTGDDWKVTPGPLRGPQIIDCGLAGTVMRFVPPVAALADGPVVFDGDPHARLRPMHEVLRGLRGLGVEIEDEDRGALPFTVIGHGSVRGGRGHHRRVRVQPVRLRAAARRRTVRRGRRRHATTVHRSPRCRTSR